MFQILKFDTGCVVSKHITETRWHTYPVVFSSKRKADQFIDEVCNAAPPTDDFPCEHFQDFTVLPVTQQNVSLQNRCMVELVSVYGEYAVFIREVKPTVVPYETTVEDIVFYVYSVNGAIRVSNVVFKDLISLTSDTNFRLGILFPSFIDRRELVNAQDEFKQLIPQFINEISNGLNTLAFQSYRGQRTHHTFTFLYDGWSKIIQNVMTAIKDDPRFKNIVNLLNIKEEDK